MDELSGQKTPQEEVLYQATREVRHSTFSTSEEKHTAAHSRSTTRRAKGSSSKKKPSKDEVKDMLRESYNFVKEENEFLTLKLKKKDRKIEELRQTVR